MELRDATSEDMMLLFRWANDPRVRENSFSTEEIPLDTHKEWFRRMMEREDVRQYIFTDDGRDVGQIRIQVTGDSAEISYSIAEEYRGRGYGKKMIALLEEKIKAEFPDIQRMTASVKPENTASKRTFLETGFSEKCTVYERNIAR